VVDWTKLAQSLLEIFVQQVQSGLLQEDSKESFEASGRILKRLEETLTFLDRLRRFMETKEESLQDAQERMLKSVDFLRRLAK
jgi:pyruvate/2-oxoacid:ferredoxin oxidoreductase beta subunit